MKLIIAGSRTVGPTSKEIRDALALLPEGRITEIVSGGARGADEAGERFAQEWLIDLRRFPADWQKHGKAAGPIRNREMAAYADAALIFWDGQSRGSANMIAEMERLGKPVKVVTMKRPNEWTDDVTLWTHPRKAGGE